MRNSNKINNKSWQFLGARTPLQLDEGFTEINNLGSPLWGALPLPLLEMDRSTYRAPTWYTFTNSQLMNVA